MSEFHLFGEEPLQGCWESTVRVAQSDVAALSDADVLNGCEEEFVQHIVATRALSAPRLDVGAATAEATDTRIPSSELPSGFDRRPGTYVIIRVFRYYVPCVCDDTRVLRCWPRQRSSSTTEVELDGQCICFEVRDYSGDIDGVNRQATTILNNMFAQARNVADDIESFNGELVKVVRERFQARKQRVLETQAMLGRLAVPVRRRDDLPESLMVPFAKKPKTVLVTAQAREHNPDPEPTLSYDMFLDIVRTIYNYGKAIERCPSIYEGKDEESLRDLLVAFLQPQYQGASVTGEAFNVSGKTDILIRHENNNVFVAECKKWHGQKHYLDTIGQLFDYLTWRDSKVAVIKFVENEDFTAVLEEVEAHTPEHPEHVRLVDKKGDSWFEYAFHFPGATTREIRVAVILFHFRPLKKA